VSIYVNGDWHGIEGMSRISSKNWKESIDFTDENYLIVLGDFGVIWDAESQKQIEYLTKWLSQKKFKLLFVAGNHENFDLLNEYPIKEWNGGKVGVISEQILWLKTGHIFNIQDKTIAVFGGASSIDKIYRKENVSWWAEEIPSKEEMEAFVMRLDKIDWKVDYLLTHTTSNFEANFLCRNDKVDEVSDYLGFIKEHLDYKHHYFGHFHVNARVNSFSTCLYEVIVKLK